MATNSMSNVANHINEVQRQNEDRLYLQDIQALLLNYEGPELSCLGDFCMDGVVYHGRNERFVLLFHKLFILLKPHHDRLEVKLKIPTDNLIVLEGADRNFQVTPFDDIKNKVPFRSFRVPRTNMIFKVSLTAATIEEKRLWCHHLKRLMMENHPAPVPTAAKSKILNGKFIRRLAQGQCRVRMELNVKTNIPPFPPNSPSLSLSLSFHWTPPPPNILTHSDVSN